MDINKLKNQYKDELLNNVAHLWLKKSQEKEFRDYFSCLGMYQCCQTLHWRKLQLKKKNKT